MSLRKIIKTRGSFPGEEAAMKLLYLALRNASKKWTRPIANWKAALNRFSFCGRIGCRRWSGTDEAGVGEFAEVKSAVSMRLVLEDYGVLEKLRRSGREQYRGRCPIHRGEGRDAFHAHLGKNIFHCFACGAGGNVLDLVAELEQCPAREAALRLQRPPF
jgi:hypothetical protein